MMKQESEKRRRSMRHGWPFFRDRRIDAYDSITERYLDRDRDP